MIELYNDLRTHGMIAGGVETCDLNAQTVQRRIQGQGKVHSLTHSLTNSSVMIGEHLQTILEKICFIKNHDAECLSEQPEDRDDINQYRELVRTLAGQVRFVLYDAQVGWCEESGCCCRCSRRGRRTR